MANIAFILLCHKDPKAIIAQAQQLTAAGDYISIHFDARASAEAYDILRNELRDNPNVTFAKKRIKCGWGEWSLVQATLYAVESAVTAFPRATHFYMLSGDCMAVKSAKFAHDFLDSNDIDYIESFDYFNSDWIKTGLREERLIYRHWFNERTQKKLFYWSFWTQRKLGLKRAIPHDIDVQIGSQWWCLRRQTIEAVLEFTRTRKDVMRFFATTWIPDETFFQTIVRHLIPDKEIETRTLTFLMFTDYGMPVTFYNDHYSMLLGQNNLFARKISPEALELKQKLGQLWASDRMDFTISNEGRSLYKFLANRGRIGRRVAPRFWEAEATLGSDRELLIISCKKWHVAKRLLEGIKKHTDIPAIAYLFSEESTPLPDLGGIETTLNKRHRHRRALMRMLFEYYDTNRMIICMDSANLDLMEDFASDRSTTRILEIDTLFIDEYIEGHARRIGLVSDATPPETMAGLLPTVRSDIEHESARIREAGFEHYYRIREIYKPEGNAPELARFLNVSLETAQELAHVPYLFSD